jgi:hypothetical protein
MVLLIQAKIRIAGRAKAMRQNNGQAFRRVFTQRLDALAEEGMDELEIDSALILISQSQRRAVGTLRESGAKSHRYTCFALTGVNIECRVASYLDNCIPVAHRQKWYEGAFIREIL